MDTVNGVDDWYADLLRYQLISDQLQLLNGEDEADSVEERTCASETCTLAEKLKEQETEDSEDRVVQL